LREETEAEAIQFFAEFGQYLQDLVREHQVQWLASLKPKDRKRIDQSVLFDDFFDFSLFLSTPYRYFLVK
jgi:hypothetical protein